MSMPVRHIALQFGHIKHFNEGLSEFSRQLGSHLSARAVELRHEQNLQFHFLLPRQWHGMFGDEVTYHDLNDRMRYRHQSTPAFDVWHGLHQHMRYRPPTNSRLKIVTIHDLNHQHAKKGLKLWWQNQRIKHQLRGVSKLVAITNYVKQDIERYWPWAPAVTVIPNGVADLSSIEQTPVAALNGSPYFLHVSRMSASKNVEALIELASIWPDKLFVLAGPESSEIDRHRSAVAAKGLSNVRFITNVTESQKAWLYAHCEAFLFPSLMEGFGLPPIEAMYFGNPVIVARRSCLPEVCADGAHYWDAFDPSHMKHVVEVALDHASAERPSRIERANHYRWSTCAQKYLEAYRE